LVEGGDEGDVFYVEVDFALDVYADAVGDARLVKELTQGFPDVGLGQVQGDEL